MKFSSSFPSFRAIFSGPVVNCYPPQSPFSIFHIFWRISSFTFYVFHLNKAPLSFLFFFSFPEEGFSFSLFFEVFLWTVLCPLFSRWAGGRGDLPPPAPRLFLSIYNDNLVYFPPLRKKKPARVLFSFSSWSLTRRPPSNSPHPFPVRGRAVLPRGPTPTRSPNLRVFPPPPATDQLPLPLSPPPPPPKNPQKTEGQTKKFLFPTGVLTSTSQNWLFSSFLLGQHPNPCFRLLFHLLEGRPLDWEDSFLDFSINLFVRFWGFPHFIFPPRLDDGPFFLYGCTPGRCFSRTLQSVWRNFPFFFCSFFFFFFPTRRLLEISSS